MPTEQQLTLSQSANLVIKGQQDNNALGTSQSLDPALVAQSKMVLVQAQGGKLRLSFTGVPALSNQGITLSDGESIQYNGNLNLLRYIADGATPATNVAIAYFNYGV